MRIVPGWDFVVGKYTLVPNPFWGGILFPTVVVGFLYFWPWLERRLTGDEVFHNLLDRPRDAPGRTAAGVGMVSWVLIVFLAGSADRVTVLFGMPYTTQVWVYRVLAIVGPFICAGIAYRVCKELQAGEPVERERRRAEAEAALAE
jgi:ubiquinol-cytochrome c reductase cytochrome b subunit